MPRCPILGLLLILAPSLLQAQEPNSVPFGKTQHFSAKRTPLFDPHYFTYSPEAVFDDKLGSIRLVRSVLLTHESGTTDQKQAEPLSDTTWARVRFDLDAAPPEDAELFIFGSAREVLVNNEFLGKVSRLASTGWSRALVPARHLRAGGNEVVLRGGGNLLVEPGRPGNSSKSVDGGKTWATDNLTRAGTVAGEYLVRLRVPQHPRKGYILTPVLDLWEDTPLPCPRATEKVWVPVQEAVPGTSLHSFLRLGASPDRNDKSWSAWLPIDQKEDRAWALSVPAELAGRRWAQLKVELKTEAPGQSPVLRTFYLKWAGKKEDVPAANLTVEVSPPPTQLVPAAFSFEYEKPMPRLEHLRKRYRLDEVIAPGKTEMEQLLLLRYWARNQWHTGWKGHPASWMPPWDALVILDCKDQPECLTMCTHYSCVFTQCCQALGWNARHCILDHHCVSEVYSFHHDKWIMMDTGNSAQRADVGLHFERKGVPLSARELHLAHVGKNLEGITVHFTPKELASKIQHLCRAAPKDKTDPDRPDFIPLDELQSLPVCQMENYRRFGFPGRNTYLSSLYPGELYQGFSPYFHDGYWWVGDNPDRPSISPEYSRHLDPRRQPQVDWQLGGTRVHLCVAKKPGQILVELESLLPNHARFEMVKNGKGKDTWETVPARLFVTLSEGDTVLRLRSVNAWGKAGPETRVVARSGSK